MKIDSFLNITERDLVRNRIKFEQAIKQQADQARKRYFAYPSHTNLQSYLEAKKRLRNASFI